MDCPCSDPLVAQDGGSLLWTETHSLNQQLALADRDVDVVFLGDSITERWRETEYGKPSPSALGSATVFDSLFSKENGGKYAGLALGISGDTVSHRTIQFICCFCSTHVYDFVPDTYATLETAEWRIARQSQSICLLGACWNE
jgi:hypothetical protein